MADPLRSVKGLSKPARAGPTQSGQIGYEQAYRAGRRRTVPPGATGRISPCPSPEIGPAYFASGIVPASTVTIASGFSRVLIAAFTSASVSASILFGYSSTHSGP